MLMQHVKTKVVYKRAKSAEQSYFTDFCFKFKGRRAALNMMTTSLADFYCVLKFVKINHTNFSSFRINIQNIRLDFNITALN